MNRFTALASALALGAAAFAVPAAAAPVFEVTPSVLGSANSPFTADKISGNASSLLTLNAATQTVAGQGWVSFNDFSKLDNTVLFTGINNDYQLWVEFSYTTKLVSGTFGTAGSLYDVTSLSLTVYAKELNPETANVYNQASLAGGGTAASVTLGTGIVRVVGTGTLDAAGPDSASFNTAGGTSFNANIAFTLSAFGKTFFTQPDPFYTNAFNSFTNTSTGFAQSGDKIALTQANGAVDFNKVPEPGTLWLTGLALVGLGVSMRRKARA